MAAQPQMRQDLGYLANLGQGTNVTVISAVSRSATDSNNAMQLGCVNTGAGLAQTMYSHTLVNIVFPNFEISSARPPILF